MHDKRIIVNEPNLFSIRFGCPSYLCKFRKYTCCAKYKVGVTLQQFKAISSILNIITDFLPYMKDKQPMNFFRSISKTGAVIQSLSQGCIFLFRDENKYYRCAIHAACLKHNLSVFQYKPYSCIIWPLIIYNRGKNIHIGINSEFFLFPCSNNSKNASSIILAMEKELRFLLGNQLYVSLMNKYNKSKLRRKIR